MINCSAKEYLLLLISFFHFANAFSLSDINKSENSFATFMAAMILKYGPEVLKELEEKQNKSAS